MVRAYLYDLHRAPGLSRADGQRGAIEPGGKLTLWTSTQGTYVVRSRLASLLGIPLHRCV